MTPSPSLDSLQIRWSSLSHMGKVRKNNEDAFIAFTFFGTNSQYLGKYGEESLEKGDFIFAVSDGMGGANAGEFASKIVVEKALKLLPKSFRNRASGIDAGFQDILEELYEESHRALCYLGNMYEECAQMGCTLSLCWFTPEQMHFAHIGDSRIYYFPQSGKMKQITQDDTYVGWLLRNGKITEREQRIHPQKNSLQKALGAGHQFVDPQVGAITYHRGDRFLICSDGVVDGLWDHDIERILSENPQTEPHLASKIVDLANAQSGRDNTTVQVIEIF